MATLKTEGGTGSVSKDGVVQESVVYYVSTPEEVLSVGKQAPSGLAETTRNWTALNALDTTGYIVTVTYEGGVQSSSGGGSSSGSSGDQVYWSYDYNLLEEPIESHWNFEEIKKKYGGWKDPNDESRWIFADYEPGKEKSKKLSPMKGVRTYMVLHLTVSKNYSARTLPNILDRVGTQTGTIKGLDFDTGGRNWLVMPVQATLRGNIWQISESWKLSEKFKWPEEVYTDGKKIGMG